MNEYFKGQYYKHQNGPVTLSLITGRTRRERFIQVITEDGSVRVPFQPGNYFSNRGIVLRINTPRLSLNGAIRYDKLSPISYDIMGPFCFFPMECRHGIVSMRHRLTGAVILNGKRMDFTGGLGYMETDSGRSFPSSYAWIQANDFPKNCSVMAAVADIPFLGLHFCGCICVIQHEGREYRLATYLGVRILACTPCHLLLAQGPYCLDIRIAGRSSHPLAAPRNGNMTRMIREAVSCPTEFRFSYRGKTIFHFFSRHASFEYEKNRGSV